jgi:hypothetical protein
MAVALPAALAITFSELVSVFGADMLLVLVVLGALIGFAGGRFASSVVPAGASPVQGALAVGWKVLAVCTVGSVLMAVKVAVQDGRNVVAAVAVWTVVLTAGGALFGFVVAPTNRWARSSREDMHEQVAGR